MKNTKAKFSKANKLAIYERDNWCCIICWQQATDCHHVYFGTESNYWKDRNDITQWVLLDRDCHNEAHSFKKGYWIRQDCIIYLKNLYG